jgi:hypothetical protein
MREATLYEARIWKLRQNGLTYTQVAHEANCSKGRVASAIRNIRLGNWTLPAVRRAGRDGCRWIEGHPRQGEWSWCDAPVTGGGAWCAEHRARVYYRPARAMAAE